MSGPGTASQADASTAPPPAALLVQNPSGQRSRVIVEPLPFLIGRQADNHLVLRDNRASRNHARIIAEDGHYVLEDLNSRHGTWVNGERIARRVLKSSDRIDLGVRESYQLTFSLETAGINRILDQFASTSRSDGLGSNNLAKLRSLVEVARALQNSLSTQEVLTAVVDAALAVTGCERGFLLLRHNGDLDVSVARDRDGRPMEANDLRVPTTVIRQALESRRELLSMYFDPLETEGVNPEKTVAQLELRSVVCVPLIHVRSGTTEETRMTTAAEATVGLLYLDSRQSQADLSAGNRELLQTLAIEASTILENARLIEQERGKQRMEDELRIARDIQQGLLPAFLPTSGWFRAAGSSWASTQVGGDYFDVRQISENEWASVVADVSGKGVSSALLASLLQGAFLMSGSGAADIEQMMTHLNQFLLERTRGEKYATVFYCTLSSSGLLSYANAGHCAPFLLHRDGRLRKLHTSGMPVGMIEGAPFQMVEMQLEPGDKIVIYSDGLTEAENAEGQFFDTERLRFCLRDHASRDAVGLHRALLAAVDNFAEGGVVRDDITALVLEYCP
jgi:serine phosphatase RsbU (regulator of sigma subunit)/pSer/pThr/pTyr-binding forkhead associated (FHA) protein